MTYTVCLHGKGSECVAGVVPDNIAQYIKDECYDDFDVYRDKFLDDDVPEEFKIAEDEGSFYDVPSFYYKYGPHISCTVTVVDENGKEVAESEASDLEKEVEYVSASKAEYKPYFVWMSVEKGSWKAEIETDEPFDMSKLKLLAEKLCYDNDDCGILHVTRIEYDGEELEVEADCTDGKSYELEFYKDEKPEEDD